eukprot:gb/GECH01013314.1/.p1 GENE.gb/GECH01013314.1/~~gb/GECH01013314.1/.p1  ORF type:complete len:989 (+),score=344.47 gb/GECH01013314.1/:1-2967(+)
MSISIPLSGKDEVVEIPLDDLPDDEHDIIDLLKDEMAALHIWRNVAIGYYRQQKFKQFASILNEAERFEPPAPTESERQSIRDGRVKVLNTLIAYNIQLANNESGESQKHELFNTATQYLNKAGRLNPMDNSIFVIRGVLFLHQGTLEKAENQFNTALQSDPQNIPAMLGKACILYNQERYRRALELYRKILVINPRCPAEIRLGIGLCLFQLGNLQKAELAFKRVLELSPENVEAKVGLAVMYLNAGKIQMAMGYLSRAYEVNRRNSMVLNHLSNYLFFNKKGSWQTNVQRLALNAYYNTEVPQIKAESCYHMARTYHVKKDYELAFQHYYQSYTLWKEFPLCNYGLAQLYIQKDPEKAIEHLKHVLEQYSENFETLKLLGIILAEQNNSLQALKYLRKARKIYPHDVEVLLLIGELEKNNVDNALDAFYEAKNLMEERGETIPYELHNNIGTLLQKKYQLDKSEQLFTEALQIAGWEAEAETIDTKYLTMLYNKALLFEKRSRNQDAVDIYIKILKHHPTYIDAYLRLAWMAHEQGKTQQCLKWVNTAIAIRPKDPKPRALIGYMHLKREEWSLAQERFEYILTKINQNDTHALLSMGALYFASAMSFRSEHKEKINKFLKFSSGYFERVLDKDKRNVYAAHGLGAILAEKGYVEEAQEIFRRVREATSDIPETWIDLGHLNFSAKAYNIAIKMYESCIRQFSLDHDPNILLYLARTQFDAKKYRDSASTLQRALVINPTKSSVWYNLALVKEQEGKVLLDQARLMLQGCLETQQHLENAQRIFKFLSSPNESDSYVKKKAEERLQYTEKLLNKANDKVNRAKEDQENAEKRREEARKKLEEQLKQEEQEERLRKEKEEEERRQEEKVAEENRIRAQSLVQQWQQQAAQDAQQKEARKKKKTDSTTEPPSIEETTDEILEDDVMNSRSLTAQAAQNDIDNQDEGVVGVANNVQRRLQKKGNSKKRKRNEEDLGQPSEPAPKRNKQE